MQHDDLPALKEVRFHPDQQFPQYSPGTATSTSPGNVLEIQVIRLHWDLLNQKLQGQNSAIYGLTSPPGDSNACLRTTGLS